MNVDLPTVFISHGSPMHAVQAGRAGEAWRALGRRLPRPKAVLVASAHWETELPMVGTTKQPETIHDFGGFPAELYRIRYAAPGAPETAARALELLGSAGLSATPNGCRGLDHGAWVPLRVMYPDADVPVLQVSMPDLDPARLFAIGRRLAPLREQGVLIIGSGFMTHGLPYIHEYFAGKPGMPEWSREFDEWATDALRRGDLDALFDFRNRAPGMPYAHPTVEHLAPLFVTVGAAADPAASPTFTIDGYWYGLAKRSFEVR
jgi:4,5-DOPA dioxygenase extradiol